MTMDEASRPDQVPTRDEALKEVAALRAELEALTERLDVVSESERQYRTLVESAKDFIFIVDRTGVLRYVNEFGAAALGAPKSELVGRSVRELFPANAPRQAESMARVFATGKPQYVETITQFPTGPMCLDTWLIPLANRNNELDLVLGISRDITDRKRALDELRYRIAFEETIAGISRRFISAPIDKLGDAMSEAIGVLGGFLGADRCSLRILSQDGQRIDTAYGWCASTEIAGDVTQEATAEQWPWGFSVLRSQTPLVLGSPSDLPEAAAREREFLAASGVRAFALVPLVYGGITIGALTLTSLHEDNAWTAQTESLLGVAGEIFTNALVRMRLEDDRAKMASELDRAERLDSIGILAGGIAHDFNNILAAIWGNVSLARAQIGHPDETCSRLDEAELALGRARDLTQQLLTFAKGGSPVKQLVELGALAMEATTFATRGSNVRPTFHVEEDLWPAEADSGQLAQVVHNLVINAVQAMPQGGAVHVSARNLVLDASAGVPLRPGNYVQITVTDEGCGIVPEHLAKLFVPYFTTKASGTGLGLATSYNIVRKHAGLITVRSAPGEGSAFCVYLPAASGAVTHAVPDDPVAHRGAGRVLVVDDDPAIRISTSAMLTHLGYEPSAAATGDDGIAMYEEAARQGCPYVVVIMDLTIPGGIGGKEAMARILAHDPKAVAIVSSGYSEDPVMARYDDHGFRGVLKKPYGLRDLVVALGAALPRET